MKFFSTGFCVVKGALYLLLFKCTLVSNAKAQTNQTKAEEIVTQYLSRNLQKPSSNQSIKFNPIEVLRSPFEETKNYKSLSHEVDSLKIEGKRIDARIAKMKTKTELNQAKKDSYRLSKELTIASDQLIDFITSYKGKQIGWLLKVHSQLKRKHSNLEAATKIFYLNQELTKVDSAR